MMSKNYLPKLDYSTRELEDKMRNSMGKYGMLLLWKVGVELTWVIELL